MHCLACGIKEVEESAKKHGLRTIEVLDGEDVLIFGVPEDITLDQVTKKKNDADFCDMYFEDAYKVGKKIHTCSLANQVSI
jgi:hypothetical protein